MFVLNNKKIHKNKILCILGVVLVILLFISFLHPTFNLDEEYSIGLIEHSYKHIIDINMLDVHPVTYYLVLKFFIDITTFWTNSLFIKVLFARIFSLLLFIMLFYILHKFVKMLGINIKWQTQLILYFLIPVIGFYSTDIRMYEFYGLFNLLMYYELVKFDDTQDSRNFILSIIFAVISSYIDYFSAVCSGVFLLIFFIEYLFKKEYKKSIYIFVGGTILIISCIPLVMLMIKQSSYRTTFPANPINIGLILDSFTQMVNSHLYMVIPVTIFLLIPIIYSIKDMKDKVEFNHRLIEILLNYLITIILAVTICFKIRVYEPKFTYPQFSIYSFFIISVIIIMLKHYNIMSRLWEACLLFVLIIIFILPIKRIYSNLKIFDIPSIRFQRTIHYDVNNKSYVHLNYYKSPDNTGQFPGKSLYITQKSVYLQYYNKHLVMYHVSPKRLSYNVLNGNINLFRHTFNNIICKH